MKMKVEEKKPFACDVAGCDFSSSTKAGVGRHKAINHGIAGSSPEALRRQKLKMEAGGRKAVLLPLKKKARALYGSKKMKALTETQSVSFCPHCGCDLRPTQMAMSISRNGRL